MSFRDLEIEVSSIFYFSLLEEDKLFIFWSY